MAWFLKIYALLKGFLEVFNYFRIYLDQRRQAQEEAKRQAREKALEDAVNAKTEEDAFKAQEGVVDNEP